jgi:hypothetical protein
LYASVTRGTKSVRFSATEGIIRGGRLFIPIRKLAERLGGTVHWSQQGAVPRIEIAMP